MRGSVVIVSFPFSDLSGAKRRPALVLATLPRGDLVLCQITSRPVTSSHAVRLTDDDFERGNLRTASTIRTDKLFTLHESLVLRTVGVVSRAKLQEVLQDVISGVFESGDV